MADQRDLSETRRVMEAMFGTLQDCHHKPQNVREVLREWGFVPAEPEAEYASWRHPAPDAAAAMVPSPSVTLQMGSDGSLHVVPPSDANDPLLQHVLNNPRTIAEIRADIAAKRDHFDSLRSGASSQVRQTGAIDAASPPSGKPGGGNAGETNTSGGAG